MPFTEAVIVTFLCLMKMTLLFVEAKSLALTTTPPSPAPPSPTPPSPTPPSPTPPSSTTTCITPVCAVLIGCAYAMGSDGCPTCVCSNCQTKTCPVDQDCRMIEDVDCGWPVCALQPTCVPRDYSTDSMSGQSLTTTRKLCLMITCPVLIGCEYALDADGCPTCDMNCPPTTAPSTTRLFCSYVFCDTDFGCRLVDNPYGCPTCECETTPSSTAPTTTIPSTTTSSTTTPSTTTTPPCPLITCPYWPGCKTIYTWDERGCAKCEFDCQSTTTTTTTTPCPWVECTLMPGCGFVNGLDGCPRCACLSTTQTSTTITTTMCPEIDCLPGCKLNFTAGACPTCACPRTCKDIKCDKREKCVLREVVCSTAPCFLEPVCIKK